LARFCFCAKGGNQEVQGIAFQISISYNACHPERSEGFAVVLLCFTVKVGKAMMPNLRRLAGNTPKKQPQILRRCAPQEDKSIGVLEEIQMRLPCQGGRSPEKGDS
jgi:hypothetical protein